MRRPLSLGVHAILLVGFAVGMFCLWMLPEILAGFPYVFPGFREQAQTFLATGMVPAGNGRITTLIVAWLHACISWENIVAWSAVSAAAFALALLPWWWSVRKLFDARIAWLSTVVLALLPMYWLEALRLQGYSFALVFLFIGFALFLAIRARSRLWSVIAFAICFGLVLASRDAFVAFLPWLVGAYLWHEWKMRPRAIVELVVFLCVAYASFTAPLLYNAAHTEGPLAQRAAVLLPSLDRSMPELGHLYPDDYTYEFEKEAFDKRRIEETKDDSFLERQQDAKILHLFGLQERTFFGSIGNSIWLFFNSLPTLFLEETVGGAFLWIFILPGAVWLFFRKRTLFIFTVGLWVSMEVLLRFVLLFGRDHLMDVGWMLALFGGIGIAVIAQALSVQWKRASVTMLCTAIILCTGMQLIQANRKQLARLYTRSEVPEAYAAAQVLKDLPTDAVVAHPRKFHLFAFSDRTNVNINKETVDWLGEEGRLAQPFKHYGVTHVIGYDEDRLAKIRTVVPAVKIVTLPRSSGVPLTPMVKFLLHLVR